MDKIRRKWQSQHRQGRYTTGANFADLTRRLSAIPKYSSQPPCVQKTNGTVDPIIKPAFQIVNAFSQEHFVWREGKWRLRLDIVADNQAKSFERSFVLSGAEVEHLRASIALVQQCLSVNFATSMAQDGGLANFVAK